MNFFKQSSQKVFQSLTSSPYSRSKLSQSSMKPIALYFLLEIAKFKRLASVRSRSTPSSGKILYKSSLFQ